MTSVSFVPQVSKRTSLSCSLRTLRTFCVISRRSFFSLALPSRLTSFSSGSMIFSTAATSLSRSSLEMISRSRTCAAQGG